MPVTGEMVGKITGIGAVLSQGYPDGSERVTAYASRLLTKPEKNYCVTRKELHQVRTRENLVEILLARL